MKKKLLVMLLSALSALCLTLGLSACGNNDNADNAENSSGNGNNAEQGGNNQTPEHTHAYDQQVAQQKYLKSEATCTQKAVYYYSCTCGEAGTATFESGEKAEHDVNGQSWLYDGQNHWRLCKNCEQKQGEAAHTQGNSCMVCGYIKIVNLEELTSKSEYSSSVNTFLAAQTDEVVRKATGATDQTNIIGMKWCIGEKTDSAISSIKCVLTTKNPAVEGEETYYEIIVNYASPIALDDIANLNSKVIADAITNATLSRSRAIAYNIKDQQTNPQIVNALLAKVNAPATVTQKMVTVMKDYYTSGKDVYRIDYVTADKLSQTLIEIAHSTDPDVIAQRIATGEVKLSQETPCSTLQVVKKAYTETQYEISGPEIPNPPTPEFDTAKVYQNLEGIYNQAVGFRVADPQNIYSYKWDLGEFQNDRTQTLKLIIQKHGQVADTDNILTFNVNLSIALSKEDLQDSTKMSNITLVKANVVREYSYTYTVSKQGNNDALIEAVAKAMNTQLGENFDYANAIKLYTDDGTITGSGGTQRMYIVVLINNDGIREYDISVSNGTIESMISKINAGNFAGALTKSVDFSENQIENV